MFNASKERHVTSVVIYTKHKIRNLGVFFEPFLNVTYQSFVVCAVNSAVITYNAALNKPAYQSSVHSNIYGTFPPNLANDGSRHTTYHTGTRCALSRAQTNPWWAVDLLRPTTVYRVDVTNRDGSGMRLIILVLLFVVVKLRRHFSKIVKYL